MVGEGGATAGAAWDSRSRAHALKALWSRNSRRHLSGGQACSCSFGGVMLSGADFETDIVEYLIGEAEQRDLPDLESFIRSRAGRGAGHSLVTLLDAVVAGGGGDRLPDGLDIMLDQLQGTLASMDEAHEVARFVCE